MDVQSNQIKVISEKGEIVFSDIKDTMNVYDKMMLILKERKLGNNDNNNSSFGNDKNEKRSSWIKAKRNSTESGQKPLMGRKSVDLSNMGTFESSKSKRSSVTMGRKTPSFTDLNSLAFQQPSIDDNSTSSQNDRRKNRLSLQLSSSPSLISDSSDSLVPSRPSNPPPSKTLSSDNLNLLISPSNSNEEPETTQGVKVRNMKDKRQTVSMQTNQALNELTLGEFNLSGERFYRGLIGSYFPNLPNSEKVLLGKKLAFCFLVTQIMPFFFYFQKISIVR